MSSTWYKIWIQQSKILLKRWSFTEMDSFFFGLINTLKCCWWFQGFDEYSLLMKEVRQVIALHMKDSLRKAIPVMKQFLMVLVPNTPKLWSILSVITKSILLTKSLSLNFQAVAATNILYVISWISFKLALDYVIIFKVGNSCYLPSIKKDWTM